MGGRVSRRSRGVANRLVDRARPEPKARTWRELFRPLPKERDAEVVEPSSVEQWRSKQTLFALTPEVNASLKLLEVSQRGTSRALSTSFGGSARRTGAATA